MSACLPEYDDDDDDDVEENEESDEELEVESSLVT